METVISFFSLLIMYTAIWVWVHRSIKSRRRLARSRPGNTLKPVSKFQRKLFRGFFVCGLLVLIYASFFEPRWFQVNQVDLYTDKLKDVSIRLVQISDLHYVNRFGADGALVETINSLKPDLIVFTGDSINDLKSLPGFKQTLHELKAPLGKFAVRGNLDESYWKAVDLFGGTGFVELDGALKLRKENDEIYISGTRFVRALKSFPFLKEIPSSKYSILLYHTPDMIKKLRGLPVDLYLAGHTHGGQVRIPFYGAVVTLSRYGKEFESGRYEVHGITLYVNRGIGMARGLAPKIRFFSRPEISVFDIHSKQS